MPQKQFSFRNAFVLLSVAFLSAIPGLLLFYYTSHLGFWWLLASVFIIFTSAIYGPAVFIRLRKPIEFDNPK